ncbi:MAG: hypothetical protein KDA96_13095 [Planctomycetaceae bacterium]|nr:hypothetical protein [Planctomycetaceae bacterium]
MSAAELRDSEEARQYLMQGIWLQRLSPVTAESVRQPMACALAMAAADDPVPPVGFIADVIRILFSERLAETCDAPVTDDLPPEVVRAYEDYALGKLYSDASFERAGVAICRYAESERLPAVAWLLARMCERTRAPGAILSPAVARSLQATPPEDLLAEGGESFRTNGLMPLLRQAYDQLINGIRTVGEVLSSEDVFELEHGTALIEFGQRLALRQTLRAAEEIGGELPQKPPRTPSRSRNVPTHILQEDTYPVGGFTSISTRGSIESLLHSQLAMMETEESRRPDLFEIKFLRSELLYYSRDENEFLRRRRTFQFVLFPDLEVCRVKDPNQNWQRMILILALQVAIVRRLLEWLGEDSLLFEFHFVRQGGQMPLNDERELLQMILAEQIQNGTVTILEDVPLAVVDRAEQHARRSTTHSLLFTTRENPLTFSDAIPTVIHVGSPVPRIVLSDDTTPVDCESFQQAAEKLIAELV